MPEGEARQERYGFAEWRLLPAAGWEQYWDRIFVPTDIKERLHSYARFALARRKSFSLVGLPVHGIALLLDLPGTGKSSLVKGLANKLAVAQVIELPNYRTIDIGDQKLLVVAQYKIVNQ